MAETVIDLLFTDSGVTNDIISLEQSMESHYCAFAAEKSRVDGGRVVLRSKHRE